jgi:hypothetical protein
VAPPGRGGQNYGWRIREGTIATPGVAPTTPAFTPLTEPLGDYGRSTGTTVVGGYVYRGRALGGDFFGRYFFADEGNGHVWSIAWQLDPASGRGTISNVVDHTAEIGVLGPISSFGEDAAGELYMTVYGFGTGGRIVRLVTDRVVTAAPANLTSQVSGRAVTLSWSGVAGATQYRIEAGSRAGAADLAAIDTGSAQASFTANGVGDGVYYVRVRALVGAAASAPSNEVIVAIGAGPCTTAPAAPVGLGASVSGRFVALNWAASGTITSIALEAGFSPGASNAALIVLDAGARAFSTTAPPGTYFVRARATNACGTSAPSNEVVVAVQ